MEQAARIAKRAYDRVEDQIDEAPLAQATVVAGVMTDKLLLLNSDPTIHIQRSIGQPDRNPNRLNELAARLSQPRTIAAAAGQPLTAQPALPNSETILDSVLVLRFDAQTQSAQEAR
jgi:hypothetical protein